MILCINKLDEKGHLMGANLPQIQDDPNQDVEKEGDQPPPQQGDQKLMPRDSKAKNKFGSLSKSPRNKSLKMKGPGVRRNTLHPTEIRRIIEERAKLLNMQNEKI